MDIRKIKKLIELLEESSLTEIEIVEGEESVRLSRGAKAAEAPASYGLPPNVQAAAWSAPMMGGAGGTTAPAGAEAAEASPQEEIPEGEVVRAPMVGTYYAASSPGAAPYVQVGDRVNEGDTLCIIEAMKMMNQIEADVSGVIKSIRVQNGEPVEYGQTLFVIDQRGGE